MKKIGEQVSYPTAKAGNLCFYVLYLDYIKHFDFQKQKSHVDN